MHVTERTELLFYSLSSIKLMLAGQPVSESRWDAG